MSVTDEARWLAAFVDVDEDADVAVVQDGGTERRVGLHDYAGLYAVPGLYEAVYFEVLGGGSPHLLADVLEAVLPSDERAGRRVLDVGAGTGLVGELLHGRGFRTVYATDLEPQSAVAVLRDRPQVHAGARTLNLDALTAEDRAWLAEVAPDVVTVAGAIGYGHLPASCLQAVTELVGPGALLAITVAPQFDDAPELAGHAAVLRSPAWEEVLRREGVHRRTAAGDILPVLALVLRRNA